MSDFKLEIDSGIHVDEILDYFADIAKTIISNTYKGPGWSVDVIALEDRRHGSIRLPRTKLLFYGDRNSCESVVMKYRKKFMRGGG